MPKIKKAILDIAEASGYEGGEPATIIGALDALTDTLAGSDVDAADCISDAITTLSPSMGPVPSGTISITSNGTDIDVASYAKADVAVPNPSTGTLSITENGENIDVTEYAAVDVAVSGGGGTDLGELMYCFAYLSTSAPARNRSTPDITRPDYAFLGSDMIADTRGINKIAAGIKVGIYNPSVASVSGLYVVTTSSDDDGDWVATFQEVTGSDISIEEVRVSSMLTQDVITWTMPELQENEYLWIHYDSTD